MPPSSLLLIGSELSGYLEEVCLGHSDKAAIVIEINLNTDRLVSNKTINLGNLDAVFEVLRNELKEEQPAMILLRLDKHSNSPLWVLVGWSCSQSFLKDRMVYAAARKIVRLALPNIFPLYDLLITSKEELNYLSCMKILMKEKRIVTALTSYERMKLIEDLSKKSCTARMALLPLPVLTLTYSFYSSLEKLKNITENVNCVVMKIENNLSEIFAETIEEATPSSLAPVLYPNNPRYYLLKFEERFGFFLSCPEASARLKRVLYAASKNAVFDAIAAQGISIWKSFDVRHPSDLNESIFREDNEEIVELPISLVSKPLPPVNALNKKNSFSTIAFLHDNNNIIF